MESHGELNNYFAVNKGLSVFYFVGCVFSLLLCAENYVSNYFQSYSNK